MTTNDTSDYVHVLGLMLPINPIDRIELLGWVNVLLQGRLKKV